MPASKDLTGQRFGCWEVLGRGAERRHWLCRCECGIERSVFGSSLTTGVSTSCGCSRTTDLTGQRFGRLVVISIEPRTGPGNTYVVCRCDCGNECRVQRAKLVSGDASACGCAGKNELPRPVASRYSSYAKGARQRGYAFELTLEEFDQLTAKPCHYCGQERGAQRGVDRVNSAHGYVAGNCAPCCWICNRFKGADLSPEELAAVARDIYLNSISNLTAL